MPFCLNNGLICQCIVRMAFHECIDLLMKSVFDNFTVFSNMNMHLDK